MRDVSLSCLNGARFLLAKCFSDILFIPDSAVNCEDVSITHHLATIGGILIEHFPMQWVHFFISPFPVLYFPASLHSDWRITQVGSGILICYMRNFSKRTDGLCSLSVLQIWKNICAVPDTPGCCSVD